MKISYTQGVSFKEEYLIQKTLSPNFLHVSISGLLCRQLQPIFYAVSCCGRPLSNHYVVPKWKTVHCKTLTLYSRNFVRLYILSLCFQPNVCRNRACWISHFPGFYVILGGPHQTVNSGVYNVRL